MKRFLVFLLPCLILTGCQLPGRTQEFSKTEFLMDTVCTIRSDSSSAISAGFDTIAEIQAATDFYSDASTVSAFNNASIGEAVPLDIHTERIMEIALDVSEASQGKFDVTIAPASSLWNFTEGAEPPKSEELAQALPSIGWEYLLLNRENHTLTKTKSGVRIDLGGCAKGYAADMAKNVMIESGATWGVLDLGGNIVVFGKNPNRRDGSWEIGLQAPGEDTGTYSQTVFIEDSGAVVTSGTYQRNFTYEGQGYHHILDPETGFPAKTETRGASVTCSSALLADCLSTACLILGREDGTALADSFLATVIFMD